MKPFFEKKDVERYRRRCGVLSLDIFDTAILRRADMPSTIFTQVGLRLETDKKVGLSPDKFRELRMEAEREARQVALKSKGHMEVGLGDIYQQLGVIWPDLIPLAEQLMEWEKQCEIRMCVPCRSIHQLYE